MNPIQKRKLIQILTQERIQNDIINYTNNNLIEIINLITKIYKYIDETNNIESLYSKNILETITNYKPKKQLFLKVELPNEIINHYQKRHLEEKRKENNIKNQTPFYYTTYELLTIDNNFKYQGTKLTGDIQKDYNKLSTDERNNQINSSYDINIQNIINNPNTISLIQENDTYTVEDGRHRLTYILKNGKPQTIPVKIKKSFPNQNINKILNILKKKYNTLIIKNNPSNNDINLLLIIKNSYYKIENETQLYDFFNLLDNNNNINKYYIGTFNRILNPSLYKEYQQIIKQKEQQLGKYIYTLNYDEIIKIFNINDITFYKIFTIYQENYQYESLKQNKNAHTKWAFFISNY